MFEFLRCILMLVIMCMEFLAYGVATQKLLKLELKVYEIWITGFFVYFGVFQIAALPMILLQIPFHVLFYLWIIICMVCNVYVFGGAQAQLVRVIRTMSKWVKQQNRMLLVGAGFCIVFTCYFHAVQQYMSWDTSYYIGTVNTTLYTDTMYIYEGESGVRETYLGLRYALSSFYMNSAVFCKLGHVSALMLQKYVMGSICIGMHGLLVFAIGKKIFREEDAGALRLLIVEIILNYGFYTIYTTATFLLIRSYEAKGFCANVVIPAVFYIALCFRDTVRKREYWIMLFLILAASVPISMSSILIVPVLLAIILCVEWIIKRDMKILKNGIICMVPNGIYLIVYYLYTRGIVIPIR